MFPLILAVLTRNSSIPNSIPAKDCLCKGNIPKLLKFKGSDPKPPNPELARGQGGREPG